MTATLKDTFAIVRIRLLSPLFIKESTQKSPADKRIWDFIAVKSATRLPDGQVRNWVTVGTQMDI